MLPYRGEKNNTTDIKLTIEAVISAPSSHSVQSCGESLQSNTMIRIHDILFSFAFPAGLGVDALSSACSVMDEAAHGINAGSETDVWCQDQWVEDLVGKKDVY